MNIKEKIKDIDEFTSRLKRMELAGLLFIPGMALVGITWFNVFTIIGLLMVLGGMYLWGQEVGYWIIKYWIKKKA